MIEDFEFQIERRTTPTPEAERAALIEKLRSLLAGACVQHGTKVGRCHEMTIPDEVYGMLTAGGKLRYFQRGTDVIVSYEPALVSGKRVDAREVGAVKMIEGEVADV